MHSFLLITFYRYIFSNPFKRIWNQLKILRFLIPILIYLRKKIFLVILALFANFECKCSKTGTFFKILLKVKAYFLPIAIILRLNPIKFWKLKAPTVQFIIFPLFYSFCAFLRRLRIASKQEEAVWGWNLVMLVGQCQCDPYTDFCMLCLGPAYFRLPFLTKTEVLSWNCIFFCICSYGII